MTAGENKDGDYKVRNSEDDVEEQPKFPFDYRAKMVPDVAGPEREKKNPRPDNVKNDKVVAEGKDDKVDSQDDNILNDDSEEMDDLDKRAAEAKAKKDAKGKKTGN